MVNTYISPGLLQVSFYHSAVAHFLSSNHFLKTNSALDTEETLDHKTKVTFCFSLTERVVKL